MECEGFTVWGLGVLRFGFRGLGVLGLGFRGCGVECEVLSLVYQYPTFKLFGFF